MLEMEKQEDFYILLLRDIVTVLPLVNKYNIWVLIKEMHRRFGPILSMNNTEPSSILSDMFKKKLIAFMGKWINISETIEIHSAILALITLFIVLDIKHF